MHLTIIKIRRTTTWEQAVAQQRHPKKDCAEALSGATRLCWRCNGSSGGDSAHDITISLNCNMCDGSSSRNSARMRANGLYTHAAGDDWRYRCYSERRLRRRCHGPMTALWHNGLHQYGRRRLSELPPRSCWRCGHAARCCSVSGAPGITNGGVSTALSSGVGGSLCVGSISFTACAKTGWAMAASGAT